MCAAMQRPHIFRTDYGEYGEEKPRNFGFLLRPTLEEFNNFIHLLDKMISEDIDKKFFGDDIPSETEITRKDGKVIIQNIGSLKMLDEWVRKFFRPDDWVPWNEAMKSFKEVRKLRQKPAHSVNENVFDQEFFKEQRNIMLNSYKGIRILRLIMNNHPIVRQAKIDIPDWLQEGRIWDK
jgi:hypothetical protein